ncbi:DUF998 domain-containing protein [Mangrovivirga cuniculi]|uniref:DUF998 domain-containing protein n=1 Tax=Mangrovivirga cuniculi TaxID=2715131 RepID=A0A4D7JWP3_9BACT|nr:DUF998 domain-containing protein [Mangrovivirga cuniculi]QCK16546.1 hypothetical protein DCC35_18320 [Mangrovivirga cuniculi]
MNKNLVFASGILGAAFFIFSAFIGGFSIEDYSHISQYISESYAYGTPYGKYLRYFGYIPSGFFLTIFAFSAPAYFKKSGLARIGFWGIGIFYGIATIITSIFPCDEGCNKEMIDPSISQIIHNATGAFTYIFVPISLLLIGFGLRNDRRTLFLSYLSIGAGLFSILFVLILMSDPASNHIGLLQRIIEASILFWIVMCSIYIKIK